MLPISVTDGFLKEIIVSKHHRAAFFSAIVKLAQSAYMPDAYDVLQKLNEALEQHFKIMPNEAVQKDFSINFVTTSNGHKVRYLWLNGQRLFCAAEMARAVGSMHVAQHLPKDGPHVKYKAPGQKVQTTWVSVSDVETHAAKAISGNYQPLLAAINGIDTSVHLNAAAMTLIKAIWFTVPFAEDRKSTTEACLDLIAATLDPI